MTRADDGLSARAFHLQLAIPGLGTAVALGFRSRDIMQALAASGFPGWWQWHRTPFIQQYQLLRGGFEP